MNYTAAINELVYGKTAARKPKEGDKVWGYKTTSRGMLDNTRTIWEEVQRVDRGIVYLLDHNVKLKDFNKEWQFEDENPPQHRSAAYGGYSRGEHDRFKSDEMRFDLGYGRGKSKGIDYSSDPSLDDEEDYDASLDLEDLQSLLKSHARRNPDVATAYEGIKRLRASQLSQWVRQQKPEFLKAVRHYLHRSRADKRLTEMLK